MKITELIEILEKELKENGDMTVLIDDECGSHEPYPNIAEDSIDGRVLVL